MKVSEINWLRKFCDPSISCCNIYRIKLLAILLLLLDFFSRTCRSLHIKPLCLCHRHPIKACCIWSDTVMRLLLVLSKLLSHYFNTLRKKKIVIYFYLYQWSKSAVQNTIKLKVTLIQNLYTQIIFSINLIKIKSYSLKFSMIFFFTN